MGGCCGAMKTGQKSLPDKKKSNDAIQEKPNGKEAVQATVSANDTGKASIDGGEIHAEKKQKEIESHTAPEQIAIPVKVSVSHAEPVQDSVEPPVQAAENVMDLETAVAPFESLPSSGDHSQQEALGSITSAEPEVLLPFQIPVQHTFTSTTTTTTTTTRHEETNEEFKLRVEEPQLDSAFPGDVQLSITENVEAVPFEVAPMPGDVEVLAKSFAAAEVESVPEPVSAGKVDASVEEAVARVERAIHEAQLPVEEDLPPPPPLEASQPEELEAGGRFEVDASLPVPAPLEVPSELEQSPEPVIVKCPLERKPSPEWEPRPGPEIVKCPLERQPSPEWEPRPGPEILVCPLERESFPEPEPRSESGIVICPIEEKPFPEPEPGPGPGVLICPLEQRPFPEPEPICPLERKPYPEWEIKPEPICPIEEKPLPEPEPRPEPEIATCPPDPPEPRPELNIATCPPEPEPRPGPGFVIYPLEEKPFSEPEPCPEPEIVVCPPYTGTILDEAVEQSKTTQEEVTSVEVPESSFQEQVSTDLGTQLASEEPKTVHESAHGQELAPASVPEPISFEEPAVTEEAAIPVHVQSQEVASTEEPQFQDQVPVELGFGSKLEEEPHIPAQDDLPPPVVEEPATHDSLLESYEVLDASAEQLPQLPVELEVGSAEPIISFTENEQLSEQPLPNQVEQTTVTVQHEQQSEEPAPYQEQQAELLEPYHEQQSQEPTPQEKQQPEEPTPYQEHQPEESARQPEEHLQDPASQQISGTFEETGDAVQFSHKEQEQPRETTTGEPLPVLEVVSEQVQESRDAWWTESGKEQSGQTTTDDIPVLELVSEQVREAHQIWWDQSGAATEEAAQPEETVTSLSETVQPSTEQESSTGEPSPIPLSEIQPAETVPNQPEETVSPIADGSSFPEVTSEPVSSSFDVVVNQQEAEIIPETKELPIVESPLSADGSSSTVPTENGEVSTQSSDETSVSNLSPGSIDDPAAGVAATKEPIPAQA